MTLTISPVTGTLRWRLSVVTGEIWLHPGPATGHRDRVLIRRETARDADSSAPSRPPRSPLVGRARFRPRPG